METPDHGQNIITRGLPKTGQETQVRAGDDGQYEAGWWKGRLNANNRERWIAKTIGGDDIVVDRATGLMWAANGNAAGCNNGVKITWDAAIDYCLGLIDFAGFSDWRLPNAFELISIARLRAPTPLIEQPPFSNTATWNYWSSTRYAIDILYAYDVSFSSGKLSCTLKTTECYVRSVRKGL